MMAVAGDTHSISRFSVVEMQSVFSKKVRTGAISPEEFDKVSRQFRGDVAARRIKVIRLLVAHFRIAEQLIRRHATGKNLRTLDALQLAVAIRMNATDPVRFICADQSLCAIAIDEGLVTINPEVL